MALGRESYPTKPIRLIVPVPPGGTFDIVARLVAAALSERLGQQFVVENRGGAGTNIGTAYVAHAAPDGYTLLLAGSPGAINATLYTNLDFDSPATSCRWRSIERAPLVMVVNPAFPAKTVPQFISLRQGQSGQDQYGFGRRRLDRPRCRRAVQHDGRRSKWCTCPIAARRRPSPICSAARCRWCSPRRLRSISHIVRAGTLRALAVTSAKRMEALPGVPAIAEFVPGYEAVSWAGIGAPAHTPADIVAKLNREVNACLADPKLKAKLADFGAVVMTGTPAEFGNFIAAEIEKWGKVIKFANIKPME